MKHLGRSSPVLLCAAALAALAVYADADSGAETSARAGSGSAADVPLKDAKLNIEHNATDKDTGFQGAIDSEGWRQLEMRGPGGNVLASGPWQPRQARADRAVLRDRRAREARCRSTDARKLPEGKYRIAGPAQENGTSRARPPGRPG